MEFIACRIAIFDVQIVQQALLSNLHKHRPWIVMPQDLLPILSRFC